MTTTRKLWLVDHDFPPTEQDLADAADAGAAEVVCSIPPALAAAGIDSFGYHEVEPPAPAVPEIVPMWRIRVILAGDGTLAAIDTAVQGLPDPTIWERWRPGGAPNFIRSSQLVQDMIAGLGPSLGLDQAAVDDILVRAAALPE